MPVPSSNPDRQPEPDAPSGGLFAPEEVAAPPCPAELMPDAPLAARMRPRTLEEFVGQESVVGPGTLLRRAIERDQLTSVLFWGPPGCGKSTLAQIIARVTHARFDNYSAVTSGVADVRKVIEAARERRKKTGQKTILFVDEIHRWNKAQQDALLPHVEDGTIVLIGATTENPYFEVNAPLLSRSRLFRLERLSDEAIRRLLERALAEPERGLGHLNVVADPDALDHLAQIAGGDARNALNALEAAALAAVPDAAGKRHLTLALAEEGAQARQLAYDKTGDEHYDTISAFIKSLRGSDPDGALYWLAKMLLAGEDIRFIARRLVIFASEDVGNADPMALVLANAAAQAVMFVGLPEAQLTLAQAVTYLAAAPKSNAATIAIGRALEEIRTHGAQPVPKHLRDSHYPGGKKLGHGKGYLYPHDFPGHYVEQEYLPPGVQGLPFYEPTEEGAEARLKRRMEDRRTRQSEEKPGDTPTNST
ncbi:MAG TPA: replication-associated recombination protein A [Chthonomonadaceae bacterium]|nr:replication-associated recombination protein A [Chthonomonadaceae bacterium]